MFQISARPSAWGPSVINAPGFGDGSILKGKFTFQSQRNKIPMDFNCAVICPESQSMLLIYICC